ncbi:MAG: NrsF family protein [Gammaproteobacteria bacterium]
MPKDHKTLIENLVNELTPVKPQQLPMTRALIWYPIFFVVIASVAYLVQEYRTGFISQIAESPRFQIELVSAIAISCVGIYISFVQFVPGEKVHTVSKLIFYISITLFLASIIWSFFDATPHASDEGVRSFCETEVVVYGLITLYIFLFLNRKGLLNISSSKRMQFGLSIALIPALIMQVACMYDPAHALMFHFSPVLIVAFIGIRLSDIFVNRSE